MIIVLVIVLILVLPTIAAGILYVMVSGLIGGPTGNPKARPVVVLTLSTKTSSGVDLNVTGSQPVAWYANFRVNLRVDTTIGTAVAVHPSGVPAYVQIVGANYSITWQNPGASGNLEVGDHFVIAYPSSPPPTGTSITFFLIWSDGSTVTEAIWQV